LSSGKQYGPSGQVGVQNMIKYADGLELCNENKKNIITFSWDLIKELIVSSVIIIFPGRFIEIVYTTV
jgi:hypothetical protein